MSVTIFVQLSRFITRGQRQEGMDKLGNWARARARGKGQEARVLEREVGWWRLLCCQKRQRQPHQITTLQMKVEERTQHKHIVVNEQ